jgi:hypothetical protein
MISYLRQWLQKHRALRQLWKADALTLIEGNEQEAYYAAQRLAARSRAIGDRSGFFHWTKVAAEVARQSSVAKMDITVVNAIVTDEFEKTLTRDGSVSDPHAYRDGGS